MSNYADFLEGYEWRTDMGVAEDQLATIESEQRALITEWIAFAKESPDPDLAKATADVYVEWEVKN